MGINLCGPGAAVTQQRLNGTDIGSLLQKMGGKGMAKGMKGGLLSDARCFQRPVKNFP